MITDQNNVHNIIAFIRRLVFLLFLPCLTLRSSLSGFFPCFRQSCIWATWPTRSSPPVGMKVWKWDHQRSSPRSPICSRWPFSLLPCVPLWAPVYASQRWLWRLPPGQGGAAGGGADQEENGDSQRQANPLLQPAWGIQQLQLFDGFLILICALPPITWLLFISFNHIFQT